MANPEEEKKGKSKQPTAKKRQAQNRKRRVANKANRSRIRLDLKNFRSSCASPTPPTADALSQLYSLIDKAAKKGLFKLNKANRLKSRLAVATASGC